MILVSSCICLCPIYWSQVLSREWRCPWSSADRRCSNYIWVINNSIAYKGASYIRDLTVCGVFQFQICQFTGSLWTSWIYHCVSIQLGGLLIISYDWHMKHFRMINIKDLWHGITSCSDRLMKGVLKQQFPLLYKTLALYEITCFHSHTKHWLYMKSLVSTPIQNIGFIWNHLFPLPYKTLALYEITCFHSHTKHWLYMKSLVSTPIQNIGFIWNHLFPLPYKTLALYESLVSRYLQLIVITGR